MAVETVDITQVWWRHLAIPTDNDSLPLLLEKFPNFAQNSVLTWLNANCPNNLKNFRQQPLTFVPQASLPDDTAYEQYIAEQGNICTRDNLHDLFNGIIWLNFPKTKALLNQLHFLDIEQNGVQPTRSALRHALTLFDENGGLMVSSDLGILQALQAFDWQTALYQSRDRWQDFNSYRLTNSQFFAFGHALLEKLTTPRKNICSHALLIHVSSVWFSHTPTEQRLALDQSLSELLTRLTLMNGQLKNPPDLCFNSKVFQPLPVLGIPYFSANQTLGFYQDSSVFRPPRIGVTASIFNV